MSIPVNDIAPASRPEPPRDRWGRYLVPELLDGGKLGPPRPYTRASTIAKMLGDTWGLERWQQRMVANGLGKRPDLWKLAQAHPDPEAARALYDDEIVPHAFEASEGHAGRRRGTALHALTHQLDHGSLDLTTVEPDDRERLQAYHAELAVHGLTLDRHHIEQTVVLDFPAHPETGEVQKPWQIAGTLDRVVITPDGRRLIGDIKTGSVKYGALEWACQLAIYAWAQATLNHNARKGTWERGPGVAELDRSLGVIIHLPSTGEPMCHIYRLPLDVGFAALSTAMELREFRSTKGLLTRWPRPINAGSGSATPMRDWLANRIAAIQIGDPEAIRTINPRPGVFVSPQGPLATLVQLWPNPPVPMPLPHELTPAQVDAMAEVLDHVERLHELPFGPPRPGLAVPAAEPKAPATARKAQTQPKQPRKKA